MSRPPAPPPSRRAKPHVGPFGRIASKALFGLAAVATLGCAEAEVETPETGEAAPPRPARRLERPVLEIKDSDLMEPLVGEKRLAAEAIEIDPYALMPRDQPITAEAREEIAALLRSLQPLDPTLTSDHHDRWFIENKRLVQRLERDTRPEVGHAALHAFTNYPVHHVPIRRTLLEIGARVSPVEATPLLAALAFNYGHKMDYRAEAVLLLAEASPETYFEGARRFLEREGNPTETAPNDEFFVRGWLIACELTDTDPTPMMASVATNFAMEHYARVVALRELADHADDPLASGALRTVLVESTGNDYLRRIAAQSILKGFPRETACTLLQTVLSRESSMGFARFLDDMVQQNCR